MAARNSSPPSPSRKGALKILPTPVSEAATFAVLPPTLSAQFAGGQLQIAWPDTGNDYVLESTDSLTPPVNWTPAPEAHTPTNGQIVVLLAPTNHQEFYRLRP